MMSQYNRRRSDPQPYGSHGYVSEGDGRRAQGRNYQSLGGGGYGYGQNVGYGCEGLYGKTVVGSGQFAERSSGSGGGRGVGRDYGRPRAPGHLMGHHGQGF